MAFAAYSPDRGRFAEAETQEEEPKSYVAPARSTARALRVASSRRARTRSKTYSSWSMHREPLRPWGDPLSECDDPSEVMSLFCCRLQLAHNEASLCQVIVFGTVQGALAGTVGFVARLVVALVSGPGSDLSEEPAFRMQAGHAGLSVVPGCPPGPTLCSAGRSSSCVGDEGPVDGV